MEKSLFWNTVEAIGDGSAAYTQAEIFAWLKRTFGDGVTRDDGDNLAVSGTSSPLTVGTGSAVVNGAPYWNTTDVSVAVPTPAVGTTAHRVVLRWTDVLNTVRVALISATDGISTPPALTQTSTVYELLLADLTITTGGVISVVSHPDYIGQRTRSFFVPAQSGLNDTDSTAIPLELFGIKLADNKICYGFAIFACPNDYVSNLTVTPIVAGSSNSGNIVAAAQYQYGGLYEDYNTHQLFNAGGPVGAVGGQRSPVFTDTLEDISVNDFVQVSFVRDAGHSFDTLNDFIYFQGVIVSYTAA